MSRRDDTLRVWSTLRECSYDKRTGASAEVHEHGEGWSWRVSHAGDRVSGRCSSRKSARAAARKYVRSLDAKPEKQLKLF